MRRRKRAVFDERFHSPNHALPFCFFEMFVPILSTTINEIRSQSSCRSRNSVNHCHEYITVLEPYKITYMFYMSSRGNLSGHGIPYRFQLLMLNSKSTNNKLIH